jgi:hypothetical protein
MKIREILLENEEHIKTYWENLESDPDFNRVYDELLDLYDKIQDYLKQ